jgi:putative membrane protein
MRLLSKFILRIAINVAALYLLAQFLSGFTISPDWTKVALAALILSLVHVFVRPVLKLLSFPLLILTLGLFNIVINFILLVIAEHFTSAMIVSGFRTRLIASIAFGILNSLI